MGLAAITMFLVLAALWIDAATTAQFWDQKFIQRCITAGFCGRLASHERRVLEVWLAVGMAGAVLTLGSLIQLVRSVRERRESGIGAARWVRRAVLPGCAAALAEVLLVLLVTRHAMETAPMGFDLSREAWTAIALLAAAQPVLVGALAVAWSGFQRTEPSRSRRSRPWSMLLCLVGMALTVAAFAAWSITDGNFLVVNTTFISGIAWVTNSGAWWPGLFAAMAALMVVAVAAAPGIAGRGDGLVASSIRGASAPSAPAGLGRTSERVS